MRLLLVEDDTMLARRMVAALDQSGYGVDVAGTVADAIAMARDTPYALCILDLGLPDGDGLDVLRSWQETGTRFPVLVLSARADLHDRVIGLDAGAGIHTNRIGLQGRSAPLARILDRALEQPTRDTSTTRASRNREAHDRPDRSIVDRRDHPRAHDALERRPRPQADPPDRAIAIDSAAAVSPTAVCRVCDAFSLLIRRAQRADSGAAVERTLARWIALRPDDAMPWRLRAEWLIGAGRRADAEAAQARYESMGGERGDAAERLLIWSLRTDDYDAANALCDVGLSNRDPRRFDRPHRGLPARAGVRSARRELPRA